MPFVALLLTAAVQTAPPATLTGLVVDAKGQPIEGAVVAATPSNPRFDESHPSATSDAKGRFAIETKGNPPFVVAAHAPGFEPFRLRDVTLETPLHIVLEEAAVSVTGRVVDGDTQEPIAGARVESRAVGAGRLEDHPRFGLVEVATDDEGRFVLSGLGTGPFRVSASAPGFGSTTRSDVAGDVAVTLYLFRGVGIYGRVLDPKGEPIEGAFVDADPTSRAPFSRSAPTSVQRSDTEGRFAILGVESGPYRLYARHPDFAPSAFEASVSDRDVEVDLVLGAGVTVTGRLVDESDKPLIGRVVLEAIDGKSVGGLIESRLSADTDPRGAYVLRGVPRGEHRLKLSARGYGSEHVEVYVGSEPTVDVGDVVLEVGIAIHGVVVDTTGTPVAGARLQAFPSMGSGRSRGMERPDEEEADAEGRFVLAGLDEGLYQLMAHARGFGRELVEAEARRGAAPITVTLKPAGTIRGRVLDPEGRPIRSFRVNARTPEQRSFGSFASGSAEDDGAFLMEDVAEGNYVLEIASSDFVAKILSNVAVAPGGVTDVGAVRLERGARLRGTVTDSAGAPVAGATVRVRAGGQRFISPFDSGQTTDGSGAFEIDGLSEGRVDVIASHPSYADGRVEGVEIHPRSTNHVELVLRMGGTLEGYVRSRDGTNIAGRVIHVSPTRAGRLLSDRAMVQSGPDGYFRFDHLEPGSLQVSLLAAAGAAQYAVQSREVEVRELETAFVEFDSRQILVQGQIRRRGAPLARAEIDLWPTEGAFGFSISGGPSGEAAPLGPRYLNGVTSDDGYFELLVDAPGEYRVSVSVSGAGLPSRNVTVPDLDTYLLDLEFSGVVISGRVVDEETEAPIAGANVVARPDPPSPKPSRGGYMRTGADGTFEIEVEPGAFEISVGADDYASEARDVQVGEGGATGLSFSLRSGLRIAGRVLSRNGLAAGNQTLFAIEDIPDINAPPTGMAFNRTVADGSFVVKGLARGRYNLFSGDELSGFGFVPGVPSGTEDVEIVLRPGGTLDVEVVDADGNTVAETAIAIVAIGGHKVRGIQTGTDAEGRASFAVPAGSLQVKAAKRNAELEGIASVSVQSGGRSAARIVVAASPRAR